MRYEAESIDGIKIEKESRLLMLQTHSILGKDHLRHIPELELLRESVLGIGGVDGGLGHSYSPSSHQNSILQLDVLL
jgi:hypothetical protein